MEMKTTTKNDYIEITCKRFCENYDTCDKSHIYIYEISGKTTCISCSAYRKKEAKVESKERGSLVL